MEWTSEDLVFSPKLDADHRQLYGKLEAVRRTIERGAPATLLGVPLWQLSKSVTVHFRNEERLMHRSSYPALEWHRSQHRAGRNKMQSILEACRIGQVDSVSHGLDDLAGWLRDHVHLADRMFAAHLRNNQRAGLVS
jgi:hemerythrin-like metal-binding protein